MDILKWIELAVSLVSALAVIIPLGIKLYNTIAELVRQRNWPRIMEAVVYYMEIAEDMFEMGADRKVWVMEMVQKTAIRLNYTMTEADLANISDLIDKFCDMAKVVNSDSPVETE